MKKKSTSGIRGSCLGILIFLLYCCTPNVTPEISETYTVSGSPKVTKIPPMSTPTSFDDRSNEYKTSTTESASLTSTPFPSSTPLSIQFGEDAFVFTGPINGDGGRNLFISNTDGSDLRELPLGGGGEEWSAVNENPSWSPNRQKIIFASDRASQRGVFDLYIVERDGSNLVRLTNNGVVENYPDWSPDGKRIAFSSYTNGFWQIFTVAASGGDYRLLSDLEASIAAFPTWSPTGSKLAFICETIPGSSFGKICITSSDGSEAWVIKGEYSALMAGLTWSPDSERIAFINYLEGGLEIFSIHIESGDLKRLTNNMSNELNPFWSPDGELIVFLVSRKGSTDVRAIKSEGSDLSTLFSMTGDYSSFDLSIPGFEVKQD